VLFLTALEAGTPTKFTTKTTRRDILNVSEAPGLTKKLPFNGTQNPSKSVLGNHPSTTVANSPAPNNNSFSLPDISASD